MLNNLRRLRKHDPVVACRPGLGVLADRRRRGAALPVGGQRVQRLRRAEAVALTTCLAAEAHASALTPQRGAIRRRSRCVGRLTQGTALPIGGQLVEGVLLALGSLLAALVPIEAKAAALTPQVGAILAEAANHLGGRGGRLVAGPALPVGAKFGEGVVAALRLILAACGAVVVLASALVPQRRTPPNGGWRRCRVEWLALPI
mmetsp:Transcript_70494/g.201919  ORF Transcript_70494/g.201919 Transcript_70494/m.201919 type:complete len:203 (-) Transcript_70494:245-853(-)